MYGEKVDDVTMSSKDSIHPLLLLRSLLSLMVKIARNFSAWKADIDIIIWNTVRSWAQPEPAKRL